ncbi:hypothetical protein HDA32_000772 [Spinactinospora alkalitolerans]|uniref:Uncharacterized protein n=1 Tax=Spinactinospora alkalitolerans TaxID=687207 RepID=A0A852TS20_9ACTN|nr:DUF6506 family protein [Spinactinospora alkalitolerans]NYE45652.1 hypothetical protein [Spinactinospora alkalitolerans]
MAGNTAIIYEEAGTDPEVDRIVQEGGGGRTTIVAVPEPAEAARLAAEPADEGVQLIELYGGSETAWQAEFIEAVDARIPVGVVGYPKESRPA